MRRNPKRLSRRAGPAKRVEKGRGAQAHRNVTRASKSALPVKGGRQEKWLAKSAGKWFPKLRGSGRGGGLGVLLVVVEGAQHNWDVAGVIDDRTSWQGRGGRGGRAAVSEKPTAGAARAIASRTRVKRLSRTLAALAHPSRVAIMVKLLEGPATYRTLQKVSGLKSGPLYHHINQLRLASLILPKQRDLYAMTRAGRNVLLVSLALMPLARDLRERPRSSG